MATATPEAPQSYAIALVLLPPPHISALIDPLRSANDRSYVHNWSAHITVLFPYTPFDDLDYLVEALRSALEKSGIQPFPIALDKVARFSTRDYETVYLGLSEACPEIHTIWKVATDAMRHPTDGRSYTPHMTLGQAARNVDSISFLTEKGKKLLQNNISWVVDSIALMRRRDDLGGKMELFAEIPLGNVEISPRQNYSVSPSVSYKLDNKLWVATNPPPCSKSYFSLATYNVLHDRSFPLQHRFTALRETILLSNADIICLQEVSDEFLWSILSDVGIQEQFRWCSRSDKGVLESERNIILLSREDFGFDWTRVELGGKHKAAAVATLRTTAAAIAIAAVHLTAGYAQPILEKKKQEILCLLTYLHTHHQEHEWIIVGDVNWPDFEDFPYEDQITDVWSNTVGGGETYDPITNSLAATTAQEGRMPQRYDRIFVKRDGRLSAPIDSLIIFGQGTIQSPPGSDHFGLKATIHINTASTPASSNTTRITPAASPLALLPTTLTDDELQDMCQDQGCFLSKAQDATFGRAVEALRALLSETAQSPVPTDDAAVPQPSIATSAVRLIVVPVGSYAMGYHNPESDIDCIVVGNINPGTFWSLVRSRIRSQNMVAVRLRRFVRDATVQMMELDVDGVKVDLQFCPAGKFIDRWDTFSTIPRDSPLFSLPVSVLKTLNAYRDVLTLRKALPALDPFRLAHRALKLFTTLHGIDGARFGFLGGFHIAILLARVCMLLSPSATAAEIVRMFFHTYSRWDWKRDMVAVPITDAPVISYRRSLAREPMVILSIEKPMVNTTINGNSHSLATITKLLSTVDGQLERGVSWREICLIDEEQPWRNFLAGFKAFVKLEVSYWGKDCMKGRALVGWLESRLVNLLVQLHGGAPTVHARLWPVRFSDSHTTDDQTLSAFYLIGLAPTSQSSEDTRRQNEQVMGALKGTIRAFEADIHKNTRYYNPTVSFISISSIGRSHLSTDITIDTHKWSDGGFDEGEDEDEENEGVSDEHVGLDDLDPSPAPKHKAGGAKMTPHLPAAKLRTSADVYNRLMWDPSVSSSDYMIGYEDRFKGVKEMPLGSWKREVEDEAFIPFHRVVHFRRKTDNVMVWDRRTKTDLVFGSGVKS